MRWTAKRSRFSLRGSESSPVCQSIPAPSPAPRRRGRSRVYSVRPSSLTPLPAFLTHFDADQRGEERRGEGRQEGEEEEGEGREREKREEEGEGIDKAGEGAEGGKGRAESGVVVIVLPQSRPRRHSLPQCLPCSSR